MSGNAPTLDSRLSRILLREPLRCASLSEYALATGIELVHLVTQLGPLLDRGEFELEVVGSEVFLNTRPLGSLPHLPINLWGVLREKHAPERAAEIWALLRTLERAGWDPVVDPEVLLVAYPDRDPISPIALRIRGLLAPLLNVTGAEGVSNVLESVPSVMKIITLTCPAGELDHVSTAVRLWLHNSGRECSVMLLEAPRYAPGPLLGYNDTSVRPASTSVSRTNP